MNSSKKNADARKCHEKSNKSSPASFKSTNISDERAPPSAGRDAPAASVKESGTAGDGSSAAGDTVPDRPAEAPSREEKEAGRRLFASCQHPLAVLLRCDLPTH